MIPPNASLHQATTIPIEIPNGKNRSPTHSLAIVGLMPSPMIKSNINPRLAMLQTLAVQRTL